MHRYKELKVWQESVGLVTEIYKATQSFPSEERFGLTSQIRRSAVSIPSNISEGAARNSKNEFNQFLGISLGSTAELETQLIIANNLKYLPEEKLLSFSSIIEAIQKMLFNLQKTLK